MQQDNFKPMPMVIKYLAGFLVGVELLLQASDRGFLPSSGLREAAYNLGALWPAVYSGVWAEQFSGQKYVMLLSHAFLHGDLIHMAMNTVVLVSISKRLGTVLSQTQLLLVFVVTAIAGGAMFLWLNTGLYPVVGASGAVFGYMAVWKYLEFSARRRMGLSLAPIWKFIGALLLLNVALWYMLGGFLAWEAHLGGFIAGWLMAMVFTKRRRQDQPLKPR